MLGAIIDNLTETKISEISNIENDINHGYLKYGKYNLNNYRL